jgi:hypothetical protein
MLRYDAPVIARSLTPAAGLCPIGQPAVGGVGQSGRDMPWSKNRYSCIDERENMVNM